MATVSRSPSPPRPPLKKPRLAQPSDAASEPSHPKKPKQSRAQKKKQKLTTIEPYSNEDVVFKDVLSLLGQQVFDKAVAEASDWSSPFIQHDEIELVVSGLSSTGESLSIVTNKEKPWVVVTPFALPGETIRARVYRQSRLHSYADLVDIVTPNTEWRDSSLIRCKYFGKCGGCQYQMLPYEKQLELKRDVVVKAYQNFSNLPPGVVPPILSTIPSPLQYEYRTKITPHFDAPTKKHVREQTGPPTERPSWLNIGFNQEGTRKVMDIEECPIATPVLNKELKPLRENIIKNIYTYKKGVSLLLRDSLEIPPKDATATVVSTSAEEKHVCVTDHKATIRERVGDKLFEFTAHSFFQNNNSALPPLTSYVRDAIFASSSAPTHLVDTYCGSGLFAITLASSFTRVAGIELSTDSIASAKQNAALNGFSPEHCAFLAGDAANIFATVSDFPRAKTALIIDPPRKGTDEKFIEQMLAFGCSTVVYVSCNVHTQARDVGMILERSAEKMQGRKYVLDSLRGFDLFPQTAHVEAIAVLRLVPTTDQEEAL